ncbi:MAG TPA: PHP domain-containing protein, partial [Stellaceae bacterium]|nr:PHP domain-containing protein [Stellaceae bacterium]
MSRYAELQATSNFSFLRGASHPHELVEQAKALGHRAIAITDINTLAGIVRGHVAAQEQGLRFVVGCRLEVGDVFSSVVAFKPKSSCPGLAGASTNKFLQNKKFVDSPPKAGHDGIGFGRRCSLLCYPT